ncbi:hypothetical protein BJY16_006360 [Actinoplanes octamycinicus]|uniref:DUF1918 domain-containing protein n=1 Tax=Actinoplanes octamycinicus TaxID=135948 RepID=A0A7W7H2Q5_9ACTN|nr:DUF1918 domain-containing protein [Actinoplanes octamycinicus]MBB4742901.1 hypothetical protein [Actinoplanes octamycinicus]GIE58246.1 hypothetical protein Aoc01nite_36480 [Actinoplanes octamycinicus]
MNARTGDRIVIEGNREGEVRRVGVITAVGHPDGRPPYHVRWLEDGHTSVIFPGPEARIEPAGGVQAATGR